MNYSIQIDQKAIMYLRYVLSQRPYAEVASLLAEMDNQVNQQDRAAAIPIQQISIVDGGKIRPMTTDEIELADR